MMGGFGAHLSAANAAALSGSTLITSVLATILAVTFIGRFITVALHRPRSAARQQAEQRATDLLRQVLGHDVLSRIEHDGFLDVLSRKSETRDRVYRINYPQDGVVVLEKGKAVEYLCVVPRTWIPDSDIFLLHKSMLEADEDHYLEIAHHFPVLEADGSASSYPTALDAAGH